MIKPHTTAKLQQTKLLGIRGEEKFNEKKRKKVRVTKMKKKEENERKREHIKGGKSLGSYFQLAFGLRHHPQALNKVIKLQF